MWCFRDFYTATITVDIRRKINSFMVAAWANFWGILIQKCCTGSSKIVSILQQRSGFFPVLYLGILIIREHSGLSAVGSNGMASTVLEYVVCSGLAASVY